MIDAYPLCWPDGWKRTPRSEQERGRFGTTGDKFRSLSINEGVGRILNELRLMGVSRDDVIISTNVPTRMDGMPRSDQGAPQDPGIAVYWRVMIYSPAHRVKIEQRRCIAIDRYSTVAGNLGAIAATLEAMRAIGRHGGAEILERSFTGFLALPEKASEPWRDTLLIPNNVTVTIDLVEEHFRYLASKYHPDMPEADSERFLRIVEARDAAKAELMEQR
jgi:hypothetical protein